MSKRDDEAAEPDKPFWKRHSLSLTAAGILALWVILYLKADPKTHAGSFFGNAIADWTGVVITIMATKWFFEKGIAGEPSTRENLYEPFSGDAA